MRALYWLRGLGISKKAAYERAVLRSLKERLLIDWDASKLSCLQEIVENGWRDEDNPIVTSLMAGLTLEKEMVEPLNIRFWGEIRMARANGLLSSDRAVELERKLLDLLDAGMEDIEQLDAA